MTELQTGDIVDIIIRGARVKHPDQPCPTYIIDGVHANLPTRLPSVTVERVAPAEWPPYLGDLWRDRDGDLWFANLAWDGGNIEYVSLCSARSKPLDGWGDSTAHHVLRQYGPLTLVHREQGQAEGVSRG